MTVSEWTANTNDDEMQHYQLIAQVVFVSDWFRCPMKKNIEYHLSSEFGSLTRFFRERQIYIPNMF